jgi:hypothetical protein
MVSDTETGALPPRFPPILRCSLEAWEQSLDKEDWWAVLELTDERLPRSKRARALAKALPCALLAETLLDSCKEIADGDLCQMCLVREALLADAKEDEKQ